MTKAVRQSNLNDNLRKAHLYTLTIMVTKFDAS